MNNKCNNPEQIIIDNNKEIRRLLAEAIITLYEMESINQKVRSNCTQ